MKLNFKILVGLVIAITIATRFLELNTIPPHLSNDEISIAYDAYSVSKTLKDSYNSFLPLSFRSHNTYKAPLTTYLTIPSILIFGNSDFAARVPSSFFGSLTILILGLLVFELTKNKSLSLLSSFILAVSPIHILTSRMAYEANIALLFLILGIYLFFLSLRKSSLFLQTAGFVSFALSLYAYHTEWIFTPFIIFTLIFLHWKTLNKKHIFFVIILFFILITPLFIDTLNNLQNTTRASTENILREPHLIEKLEDPNFHIIQKSSFIVQAVLEKYSSYFNLSYIFFTGYNLLPEGDPFQAGLFLFPFLPFFLFGITRIPSIFKEKSNFIYILLITSPIVASLTSGPQSTSRNLVSVIPVSVFSAVGILVFWRSVKNIWKIVFVVSLVISLLYFLAIFYYHFPKDHAEGFQYGYKQIALFIKPIYQDFKQIIIDPRFGSGGIYAGLTSLYIPYYTNLDPVKIQQSRSTKEGYYFDKYQIRNISWKDEEESRDILFIVPSFNPPPDQLGLKRIHTITLPNYTQAFYLYKAI